MSRFESVPNFVHVRPPSIERDWVSPVLRAFHPQPEPLCQRVFPRSLFYLYVLFQSQGSEVSRMENLDGMRLPAGDPLP